LCAYHICGRVFIFLLVQVQTQETARFGYQSLGKNFLSSVVVLIKRI